MDFNAPHYSLLALIVAVVSGFVIGRVTSGSKDPRRIEAARREAQRHDTDIRNLASRLSPETSEQVRRLLSKRDLIGAIKLVRAELKCGLKEAKETVEHFK